MAINTHLKIKNQPRSTEATHYQVIEKLKETSMELSLIHCGQEQCEALHFVQAKRDELILHFVFNGKGSLSVGEKHWNISAGQMFLMYPGTVYTYIADAKTPWSYAWIGFKGALADTILLHCGLSAKNPVGNFGEIETIKGYFNELLQTRGISFADDLKRHGILLNLFSYLAQTHAENSGITNSYQYSSNIYVNHAIEYISSFYANNITVASISEHVGVTRAHLNNCFQKEIGLSVQTFLIEYRLHQGARLLTATTDSVNKIAEKVGYHDPLAFSKAFKKKFGKSPKFYRNDAIITPQPGCDFHHS